MKEKKTVNWILKNYPYTIGEEVCDILRKYRDGRLVERTQIKSGLNANKLLAIKLKEIGADGLVNCEGDLCCGCGLGDLAPCEGTYDGGIDLNGCRPAKRDGNNFYPMKAEEQ